MSNQGFSYSFHLPIQNVLTGANLYPEGLDPASSPGAEQKKKNIRPTTPRAPRQINPTTPHKRGGGGGGWHASHRALRANYIINARLPANTSFDSRRREARTSAISRRIFYSAKKANIPKNLLSFVCQQCSCYM